MYSLNQRTGKNFSVGLRRWTWKSIATNPLEGDLHSIILALHSKRTKELGWIEAMDMEEYRGAPGAPAGCGWAGGRAGGRGRTREHHSATRMPLHSPSNAPDRGGTAYAGARCATESYRPLEGYLHSII